MGEHAVTAVAKRATPLEVAKSLARQSRLVIKTVRGANGTTRHYVYRQMDRARVFVGERTTDESLLRLVKNAAGSTSGAPA